MALTLVWGLGHQLSVLAPRLAPISSFSDLLEIETALLEIETTLTEIETILTKIETAMHEAETEIEIVPGAYENYTPPATHLNISSRPSSSSSSSSRSSSPSKKQQTNQKVMVLQPGLQRRFFFYFDSPKMKKNWPDSKLKFSHVIPLKFLCVCTQSAGWPFFIILYIKPWTEHNSNIKRYHFFNRTKVK